jgi:hypothetical protein
MGLPMSIGCLSGRLLSNPTSAASSLTNGILVQKNGDTSKSKIKESREKRRVSHPFCDSAKTPKLNIPSTTDLNVRA